MTWSMPTWDAMVCAVSALSPVSTHTSRPSAFSWAAGVVSSSGLRRPQAHNVDWPDGGSQRVRAVDAHLAGLRAVTAAS